MILAQTRTILLLDSTCPTQLGAERPAVEETRKQSGDPAFEEHGCRALIPRKAIFPGW
jgi:hypothetical protein